MDDKAATVSLSRAYKHRGGALVHRRGLLFRLARHVAGLPRLEAVFLACILLLGAWGALAVIGIVNSPTAM
jgi:hypothetical protein